MISLVLPAWLAGLVHCLSQEVFSFSKSRVETLGWRFDVEVESLLEIAVGLNMFPCICSAFRGEVPVKRWL